MLDVIIDVKVVLVANPGELIDHGRVDGSVPPDVFEVVRTANDGVSPGSVRSVVHTCKWEEQ